MSNGTSTSSRGQLVKPELAQGRTIASSVAELVSSVILQPSATKEGYEKVEWVSFEECDLTDFSLKSNLRSFIGPDAPMVMVLGLTNGYQAWVLMSNGECEEFLSVRMGRMKFVKFLPHPEPGYSMNNDAFVAFRPLIATCDSTSAGRPFCALNIASMKSSDVVHSLRYDEPIGNILCNKRAIVVSFPAKLVVYDTATITELFYIKLDHASEKLDAVPAALGDSWLAYSDTKLNSSLQSCGGVSSCEANLSYTSQVMNAAKNLSKTVTNIGGSMAISLTGSKPSGRSKSSKSGSQSYENLSVVTIIDIKNFPKTQTSIHTSMDAAAGVVAHFVANMEERLTALKFNSNSSLLLACGGSGQQFNLFAILPHPSSPVLGAVHHLYTLRRGNTNAKVQDIHFAQDSRWVAVTTTNGTTHVFPITPYGGAVSVRTHGSPRVANKESRFYRSAGLDSLETIGPPSPPHLSSSPVATKASPIAKESHPSLNAHHISLSRVISNPRLPPYPSPTVVYALAKIKQQFGAMGPLAPTQDSAPAKKHGANATSADDLQRISATFAPLRGMKSLNPGQKYDDAAVVLFVLNCYGEIAEYVFNVKAAPPGPGSKLSADAPIELTVTPGAQWQIGRQKKHPDLPPPLVGQHSFMMAAEVAKASYVDSCRNLLKDTNCGMYSNIRDIRAQNIGDSWISEVEIVTYSGPHRRLWMGPQFTFKTYVDQQHSASLISPGDRSKRFDRSEPMPVPGRIPMRSIPVLIEAGSVGSIDQLPGPTVEICGSWSDNDYISCDEQEGRLRESIADAMRDQPMFGPHTERPSGSSEELSSVGSETARPGLNHSPSRESQLQFAAGYIDP